MLVLVSVIPAGKLDVVGHTELDSVNVSGLSTFASDLDINASVDIDGHTELDNCKCFWCINFCIQWSDVNLPDNTKIMLGDSNDLQILHQNGTGNSIQC